MEASAIPIIPPADDKAPKQVKEVREEPKDPPKLGPKGPGTTSTKSGTPTKFHRELAEFMSFPALAFELKGDIIPAYIWNTRITRHAYAWGDLAEKNPALKRKLQSLMEGGAYGALIITGLALIVPIAAYYGLYPKSMINPFALKPHEIAELEAMQANRENGYQSSMEFFMVDDDPEGAIPQPLYD